MARPCLGRPANREHAKAAVSFMVVVGYDMLLRLCLVVSALHFLDLRFERSHQVRPR